MPEYETDRTEKSKQKSQETLESSQIQPHQQQHGSSSPFSSKDQTSEERNEYKETGTQTIGTQHFQVKQNLDDERNEEKNAADRASEQDKPLTGDQMNALTRDLAEHIEGMGNERRVDETATTDDLSSASQENNLERTSDESDRKNRGTANESICEQKNIDTRRDDINPDNDKIEVNQLPSAPLTGDQMNALTRDLAEHIEGMGNERRVDETDTTDDFTSASRENDLERTSDESDSNSRSTVNESICAQKKIDTISILISIRDDINPDNDKIEANQRYDCKVKLTSGHPSAQHDGSIIVENPSVQTTTNKNQTHPNEEMAIKRHGDEDLKADLPVEHQTSTKATTDEDRTTTSQINKNVVPDRKCEETERNHSTVAKPICEKTKTVADTRCSHCHGRQEQSIHQKNEQLCEEHEEAKSVEKPTAPTTVENKQNAETNVRSENDEQSNADSITDEQDKESEIPTAPTTVKTKQNAEKNVRSENDEQSKADSITDEQDKESEEHTADGEQDSEKLKKETVGSNDHEDTVLTEHVDRNRPKSALAKTDEAFTATAQKLAYEAKHLAVRVKDMFTKKRHHEVEIWPDGVVVGKEPENEPEPTEYIKSSHEVIAKFNERINSENSGSDLNDESEELDTHRPAQTDQCAEEVCNTKAEEVRADETEGSSKGKCDAEKPSEAKEPIGAREMAKACGHVWKEKAMEKSGETDEKVCKCKETERTAESNEKSAHITVEKSGETNEKMCKCKENERTAESNERSAHDSKNENHEEKSSAATSQSEHGQKVRQTAKNQTETQSHIKEQADTEETANDEHDDHKGNQTLKLCNPTDIPESERAAWWDNLEKEATKRVNNLSNEAVAHGAKKIDKDGEKGQTEPTEDQKNLKNSADKSDESQVANISDAAQTKVANDGQQSTAQKAEVSKEKMETTAEDTSARDHPAPNADKGRKQVESAARQQSTGAVPQHTNYTRA